MKTYYLKIGVGVAAILIFGFLTSCNKCANNFCLNGGLCIDGTCDCPPGFIGNHCESAVEDNTPTGIELKKIVASNIPYTNEFGTPWDVGNGPDPQFYITNLTSGQIFESNYAYNVTSSFSYDMQFCPEAIFQPMNSVCQLEMMDWDGSDNQGTWYMTMIEPIIIYPEEAISNANGILNLNLADGMQLELYFEYIN